MANVNPGQSLTNQTTAAAGTSVDMMGAATAVAGIGAVSMTVIVSGYTASSQIADVVPANPYANVGLEVSLDGTTWFRIANITANGNTPANKAQMVRALMPCRFARATLDALDTRITGITVNAWVCGSSG